MKSAAINSSMKRKHNTSLLKVANIKKRRTHQKMIASSDFVCKEVDKIQTDSHDTLLHPVDQLTKTRTTDENLLKQQNKYALQQEKMMILDGNQSIMNPCGCQLCTQISLEIFHVNYQRQDQIQLSNQNKVTLQQTNNKRHFDLNMKQTGQFTANNFKIPPGYFSNKQTNVFKMKPNLSIFNHNQSHVPNLKKNVDFYNQYVPCYDQKQTFAYFDQFSTFYQASDRMKSSTESFDNDTNNVMPSLKFDDSYISSQQFKISNNLNYCNYVY